MAEQISILHMGVNSQFPDIISGEKLPEVFYCDRFVTMGMLCCARKEKTKEVRKWIF